jgi:small-conductance mechanosensitive channel
LTEFLQSNLSLVVGAALALIFIGIRAVTVDKPLRHDLRAAILLLFAFVVLRASEWALQGQLIGNLATALRLGWMLTFAFGVIRALVATSLWLLRLRRATPTPKILRDVISIAAYALAAVPIVKATLQVDLGGLVATSAILSVVLGLALQDTLGNLFAGLSLQLERPFEVGDVVEIGAFRGRVAQIGWRAMRIETFRGESITLPNNAISREAVKNYSRGGQAVGTDVLIGVSYQAPPNKVRQAVLDVLTQIPQCVSEPPPHCRTWQFADSAVQYQVRYFVREYADSPAVLAELHTRLWYRFSRDGIEIPFPQRVVHMRGAESQRTATDEVAELFQAVDLLAVLSPEEQRTLAAEVIPRRFGAGERIIREGETGNTFYVVASGTVAIQAGSPPREVAQLSRGDYFGEMSLLTGAPRVATVVAAEDVLLYEIHRATFARLFEANPKIADRLAELLGRRSGQLQAMAQASGASSDSHPEARRIFSRLKEIFGLEH